MYSNAAPGTDENFRTVVFRLSGSFVSAVLRLCDGIRGQGHFAAGPDRFRFGVRRTMRVQKEVSIKFTGD